MTADGQLTADTTGRYTLTGHADHPVTVTAVTDVTAPTLTCGNRSDTGSDTRQGDVTQ